MSLELGALRIFTTVAELASFTRAAEQLGLPKARVSTTVQQLESEAGTRLLHRTTRSVRLTPDGEQLLGRALALLADADDLQSLFQQAPSALRGRLRLDLPIGIARTVLIPRLPAFLFMRRLMAAVTDRTHEEGAQCEARSALCLLLALLSRRFRPTLFAPTREPRCACWSSPQRVCTRLGQLR